MLKLQLSKCFQILSSKNKPKAGEVYVNWCKDYYVVILSQDKIKKGEYDVEFYKVYSNAEETAGLIAAFYLEDKAYFTKLKNDS